MNELELLELAAAERELLRMLARLPAGEHRTHAVAKLAECQTEARRALGMVRP